MTKVEAIEALMHEYNGIITLEIIYNEIEKYYPNAKSSNEWKSGIRGVLYRELGKKFKRIDKSIYSLIDYDERNLIVPQKDLLITEQEVLSIVRTQQQNFRKKLLNHLKLCPITLINDKRLLVASHIKPWCLSNNDERVDIYNGFMLSPLYDKLFDSGLITFTDHKELLVSSSLSEDTIKKLNINTGIYDKLPVKGREKYLEFHNEKIFIK